jgi:TonB-dependent receptor
MNTRFGRMLNSLLFFVILISNSLNAQSSNSIEGKITDKITIEALIGANIFLQGTAYGAATDINGKYIIKNVPTGEFTLQVSYLGYKQESVQVIIDENTKMNINFELDIESLEGETVVVTAQALGQKQAINQQLSSKNIKNVVSAARIQEVPDANAAESVGRLPGVSILREGGEGNKVVVRGLEPKFNAITINGVKLSSSGFGDRGADLSMISSGMLAGIEVSKSITADMDANVIGGAVNFQLRDASSNESGDPKYGFTTQGGYNGLDNANEKFRNFKVEGTVENRFFNNSFGVFLQGSFENRNLSSNELNAGYNSLGNSEEDYLIGSIAIDDMFRVRERANVVISFDYKAPFGTFKLSNLLSTSSTELNDRQQFYNVDRGANIQRFTSNFNDSKLNNISNIFNYENDISIFNLTASFSHSYSETDTPDDWQVVFVNTPANIEEYGSVSNADPRDVVRAANNDLDNTLLQTVSSTKSFSRERALAGSIDFETQLNISHNLTATLKFGGKYQHQKRSSDSTVIDGQNFSFASGSILIDRLQADIPWLNHLEGDNTIIPMEQFIDQDYDYGRFLDSEYDMIHPLNFDRMQEMVSYLNNNQLPDNITYNYNVGSSIRNDYNGTEEISAAYLMTTLNVGSNLTIIPGLRYQELRTTYIAPQGVQGPTSFADYQNELVTVSSNHGYWLPSALIQFKPFDWFDVRLAYTNTLSYPDYASLVPRINVNQSAGLLSNNGANLKPIESQNYDAYFSFYNNTIGLFTAGVFLKEIKNLIYFYEFVPDAADLVQYYPEWVENKNPIAGINVQTYINNPFTVENYGIELDWQTHFWYLPSVLSGLVLNVNYTHIFSEAEYPNQVTKREGRVIVRVDSSYKAPLLFQPDDIINITVGYDYKDFSLRLSTLYTADIFTGPDAFKQLRSFTDAYTRWDLSLKQKLPFVSEGLEVFVNYNNISGSRDQSSIAAEASAPARIQAYDSMLELGFRGKF